MFIVTFTLSVTTKLLYINVIVPPLTLLTAAWLYRGYIKSFIQNQTLLNKSIYLKSYFAFIVCIILQALCNTIFSHTTTLQHPTQTSILETMIPVVPLYTVVMGPILEEIIFRKIIFGSFQKDRAKFSLIAATISSILFAASHMDLKLLPAYFAVGMTLCYYYHSSKTLFTTILAHIYLNFLVLFFQSIYIVWSN